MDVKFKPGVSLDGIKPEAIRIIVVAAATWAGWGKFHVTVTSVTDGPHSRNSLHYKGLAVDLRTRGDDEAEQWPEDIKRGLANTLRNKLGNDYDVVVEGDHIHVEYDPEAGS